MNRKTVKDVKKVCMAYSSEIDVKRQILEVIGHADNRPLIMFCLASWRHQVFITDEITVAMETILIVTSLKKLEVKSLFDSIK